MSSDKRPLQPDHGAGMWHHAKDEARRNQRGKPHHEDGLAHEHAKPLLPEVPWALSGRSAPKQSDTEGFHPATIAASNPNDRQLPFTAAPGHSELGSPEYAARVPKRHVAGKAGPLHEEQRSVEERRASVHGPHALKGKLESELRAADRARRSSHHKAEHKPAPHKEPSNEPTQAGEPEPVGDLY